MIREYTLPIGLTLILPATGAVAQCVTFSDDVRFPSSEAVSTLTMADFNGDGSVDAAAASGDAVVVFLNDGAGDFAQSLMHAPGLGSSAQITRIINGDFDGDGDVDLAVSGLGLSVSLLFNDGSGGFSPLIDSGQAGAGLAPFIEAGDVDGDGDLDIVLSVPSVVMLNNGSGFFHDTIGFPGSFDGSTVALGDMDADGDTDIVTTHFSQGVRVALQTSTGSFIEGALRPAGPAVLFARVADLDADGSLDVIVANSIGGIGDPPGTTGQVTVLYGPVVAPASETMSIEVGDNPRRFDIADIDGDGRLDIVAANAVAGTVSVVRGLGDRAFASDVMVGNDPGDVLVRDVDGDSQPDIVFTAAGITVLHNETAPASGLTGDVNGDGSVNVLDILAVLANWN